MWRQPFSNTHYPLYTGNARLDFLVLDYHDDATTSESTQFEEKTLPLPYIYFLPCVTVL
jgi:hypothetical protein